MRRNPAARVALPAILLLAFALRVAGLGAQELRGDEAFGYFFQQRSYAAILDETIALAEPHPVASYFVAKAWGEVAGSSEYALRFTAALWSTLAVALLVRLARRLALDVRVELLGALLMALSPYALWHAQDARMYSMSLALNSAVIWLALEALARRRWQWVTAYLVAAWLAMMTHYFSAFVLLGLTLFVVGRALFHAPARRAVADWLMWNLLLAVGVLPWLNAAGSILGDYGGNGDSPGFVQMAARALAVLGVGESVPLAQRPWWALVGLLLLVAGSVRLWLAGSSGRRALWLLLCVGPLPVLMTWASALNRPIFNERYLVAALPAVLLLMAATVQPLPEPSYSARAPWLRPAAAWTSTLLLALLFAGLLSSQWQLRTNPAFSKTRGWRELAATLQGLGGGLTAEAVHYAQNYPDPTLWYYTGNLPHSVLPPAAGDEAGAEATVAALAQAGVQRLILAEQPNATWDPDGLAHSTVAHHYAQSVALPVANWTVTVWESPMPALTARDDAFRRGLALAGIVMRPETPTPGGLLNVLLAWQAEPAPADPLTGTEAVSVQLLDAAGALLAQSDQQLPATLAAGTAGAAGGTTSATTQHGILLPAQLPPGELRLIVAVYDPAEAGAPRLPASGGAETVELARWQGSPAVAP